MAPSILSLLSAAASTRTSAIGNPVHVFVKPDGETEEFLEIDSTRVEVSSTGAISSSGTSSNHTSVTGPVSITGATPEPIARRTDGIKTQSSASKSASNRGNVRQRERQDPKVPAIGIATSSPDALATADAALLVDNTTSWLDLVRVAQTPAPSPTSSSAFSAISSSGSWSNGTLVTDSNSITGTIPQLVARRSDGLTTQSNVSKSALHRGNVRQRQRQDPQLLGTKTAAPLPNAVTTTHAALLAYSTTASPDLVRSVQAPAPSPTSSLTDSWRDFFTLTGLFLMSCLVTLMFIHKDGQMRIPSMQACQHVAIPRKKRITYIKTPYGTDQPPGASPAHAPPSDCLPSKSDTSQIPPLRLPAVSENVGLKHEPNSSNTSVSNSYSGGLERQVSPGVSSTEYRHYTGMSSTEYHYGQTDAESSD